MAETSAVVGSVSMPPWKQVAVQPSYGKGKTYITWRLARPQNTGEVYVYRSADGNAPWTCLNEGEPVVSVDHFEDNLFFNNNKLLVTFYRLMVIHEGQNYPSPIIGLLDHISRPEYGGVQTMMGLEFLRMRSGNGIKVFMLPPLVTGVPAAGVDPLTWQKLKTTCDDTAPGTDGFGRPLAGGYGTPLTTWVELYGPANMEKKDDDAMGVSTDEITTKARFLAFPRPQRGYLIIDPRSDNRYVVDATIQAYNFRGITPIAYDLSLQLLDRNDPRYKIEVPIIT